MQDIIVYIIVTATIFWLINHFVGPKQKTSSCAKCPANKFTAK